MSPTDSQTPANYQAAVPMVAQPTPVHVGQPKPASAMDAQRPHPESEARLRGGDGGGMCPGRFCFIIPCPIPCNCCIIPL